MENSAEFCPVTPVLSGWHWKQLCCRCLKFQDCFTRAPSVFWPHHFLMIGQKTAVYFVAVALIEIWKAEVTFRIRNKHHPMATANFPWGCANMTFLLAVKNKMLIFFSSKNLYSCFQDDPLNVTAFLLWCFCPLLASWIVTFSGFEMEEIISCSPWPALLLRRKVG